MFFGGINGINTFSPEKIDENNFIPPVYITDFKVFNERVPLPNPIPENSRIELIYSQNYFSFEFTALNYTLPEKNQYAYKLEGFDKDWHTVPSSQRYASYTNLDPGEYILRVKGSNNDGIWNEKGASVKIEIIPPFWMTWWFQSFVLVLILSSGGGVLKHFMMKPVKLRIRKMEEETLLERERLRIARDMHDDFGSRLTEIRLLSELGQSETEKKAVTVLKEVSEATKNILSSFNEIVWSINPQNDSIEKLTEYIGQYAAEYLSKVKIRCRLKLPEEFQNVKVTSEIRHNIYLAVKEALNNAVKHSCTPEVNLIAEFGENNTFIITIRDFGKGFVIDRDNGLGNGLNNMKNRLENIGGRYEIMSTIDTGTTIKFIIPAIYNN